MENLKIFKSKTASVLKTYSARLRAFRWNARMYLIFTIIFGAAMGVRRLIFNFFVLSLGYDEALLGTMITVHNLTALLAALPMGYLADRLGRKLSLISSTVLVALSVIIMVAFPKAWILIVINIVFGLGMSISSVTMGPFLMENSGETERTYLFSFGQGLQMAAGFVGNWIGGYLPGWMGSAFNVSSLSSTAYGNALLATSVFAIVGVVPLIMLRNPNLKLSERSSLASLSYLKDNFGLLSRLVIPSLITSIGAGLIMPFMNIFFRNVHNQPDQMIGTVFAWGSLAMGVGLIIAPALADRLGKIQVVVLTQGLSIPFLFILGFSPWFVVSAGAYFVRLALMNMSGPVYQTLVMEQVDPQARATVASLTSMASSFGWAFSPSISGWIQVNYGFRPAFVGTMALYAISIFLYWFFFLKGKESIFRHKPVQELAS